MVHIRHDFFAKEKSYLYEIVIEVMHLCYIGLYVLDYLGEEW
jgi:hypothetical protein